MKALGVAAPSAAHILAHLDGALPWAPDWFARAVADEPERTAVQVEGAHIEVLAWGRVGMPGILLLHGNAAHADWYSFIGPLLAPKFRVVAMSWSGMGRSGWRSGYSCALHALEAITVAHSAGMFQSDSPPVFAAHSFGTFPLMAAAAIYGEQLGTAILVDSPLRPPRTSELIDKPRREWRAPRTYRNLNEALRRFRLIPPQPCGNLYAVDHVARKALKPVEASGEKRWTWSFDPFIFREYDFGDPAQALSQAKCRVALVRGALSTVATAENHRYALDIAPSGTIAYAIPGAGHHVMLDQPIAFATLLDEISRSL